MVGWRGQWHGWLAFCGLGLWLGTHRPGHLNPSLQDAYGLPRMVDRLDLSRSSMMLWNFNPGGQSITPPHTHTQILLRGFHARVERESERLGFCPLQNLGSWPWQVVFFCDIESSSLGLWSEDTASCEEYIACLSVPGLSPKPSESDFQRGAQKLYV